MIINIRRLSPLEHYVDNTAYNGARLPNTHNDSLLVFCSLDMAFFSALATAEKNRVCAWSNVNGCSLGSDNTWLFTETS
jgi:hypothetical protein